VKLVIQRVSRAEVRANGRTVGDLGKGLLVLVGCERGDTDDHAHRAARRISTLRVFEDEAGKMNLGLDQVGGGVLAVSQFTLAGSIRKGRRPSFGHAMAGPEAERLFDLFVESLENEGVTVSTGVFGAMMEVDLINDGPVTLIWEDPPTP
jgi:D-tyrosyl-tRNA(Tyr) deacylase